VTRHLSPITCHSSFDKSRYLYFMPQEKEVKSVLNKHKKRDSWFLDDYSVNPYEGCSCNCYYCYIRGSKYGENMDEGLFVKTNLPQLLEKQLQFRVKKKQYGITVVGSATDAYIPYEEKRRMTRSILQLMLQYQFPVFISTKRKLILRDIDLLQQIDKTAILPGDLQPTLKRGLILSVSIATLDEKVSNVLEPGALPPLQRLELVQELKSHGFLVGVNAMPLLPFISDKGEPLENIIAAAAKHNADYILTGGLTLFGNGPADSKTLYYRFLEQYYPQLVSKYKSLYRIYPFPPKQYHEALRQRVIPLCEKYKIRNSILL
jgi:DNA repair photolyase